MNIAASTPADVDLRPGTRITVSLIPRGAAQLAGLVQRTGLSRTDLVNRAISLYEFIDRETSAGKALLLRDPDAGTVSAVHLS